jgi:hypothetical protein
MILDDLYEWAHGLILSGSVHRLNCISMAAPSIATPKGTRANAIFAKTYGLVADNVQSGRITGNWLE